MVLLALMAAAARESRELQPRQATICQDEWRAWRHRGLGMGRWDAGRRLEAKYYCLILSMNVLDVP